MPLRLRNSSRTQPTSPDQGFFRRKVTVQSAVASGLALRYDGGSCFRSDHYQAEIDHLGIARSPAFHYEPETNGCAEKAIQTLKEQILWLEPFDTLDELRTAVRAFGRTYNQHWLIERHGYRTPTRSARTPPRTGSRPATVTFPLRGRCSVRQIIAVTSSRRWLARALGTLLRVSLRCQNMRIGCRA
jgi:Integrase core domain